MTVLECIQQAVIQSGSIWIKEEYLNKFAKKCKVSLKDLSYYVAQKKVMSIVCDRITYYSLPDLDRQENSIASNIMRIMNSYDPPNISDEQIDELIKEGEKNFGVTLHEQQRLAVIGAVKNGLFIITGGPGTGKTCTLQVLAYVLTHSQKNINIRFTAPTGKAARRISESTGKPAKTTQKELGITFSVRHKRYFTGNVLIIDEVSMLDMETAYFTFDAIVSGQKVIIVGDINQLPSVGPGAILRDLLFSGVVPFVQLTKTFRQSNDSTLFQNIQAIRNGESDFVDGSDFVVKDVESDPIKQIVEIFKKECEEYGIENVACLLPYRKAGILCSDNINNILQNEVNPVGNKPYLSSTTEKGLPIKFTVGDPVMQLVNRKECANGDVGMVENINKGCLYVRYADGTRVVYTKRNIQELSLAYSMSINKSQGSEYKSVVMAMTSEHAAMLKRNLLYTGVTRAKKKLTLLKEDGALMKAICVEDEYTRHTFLIEKLQFLERKNKFFIA